LRDAAELRGYAVCSTARSGSTYLCTLLESTGRLGHAVEYFNARARRMAGLTDYPDDPQLQLAKVLELGSTPNGVYGLKIFADQAELIRETRWAAVLPNLAFVYLERGDLLGQAISQVRAAQTDQWRHDMPVCAEPRYDAAAITRALRNTAKDQARWNFWFARTGIEPLRLRYEDIIANPQSAVDGVAALVGVERLAVRAEDATVRVQRDALSEAWRARYLQECGARSYF
jgi:LPS sulfotransferase NodH